jgi:hypothetical protein
MRYNIEVEMAESMRHCIGINNSKKPYRNHFCGSNKALDLAVSRGLAIKTPPRSFIPDSIYHLTKDGYRFLGFDPPYDTPEGGSA